MSDPTPYNRTYSFTDYQAGNPSAPLPGVQVDNELENVEQSLGEAIDAIKDVRRSDGALKNGIVTVDSLSPQVAAGVGAGALASAEAAAASADAASDSAVAAAASATAASGSATSASGYASDALTSRNEASGFSDDSAAAASLAQTARDYANQWATAAEGMDVDDGVNPVGKSSYHWAQVALDAAAGSIADGAVTTAKLADGALSADSTGRAKMADGFITSAKIADGILSADTTGRAKMADGFVNTAKLANSALSADTTGRAKMADGFLTAVKAAADFVFGQTAKTTPVDADTLLISDSAASNVPKKLTFANLKTFLSGVFAPEWVEVSPVATTSGAAIDWTSIPAGVTDIELWFNGVSVSSTDHILVRIGTGGTPAASGYGSGSGIAGATVRVGSTIGFILFSNLATLTHTGRLALHRTTGNTWVSDHAMVLDYSGGSSIAGGGVVTLAGALDIIRLQASGAQTFDAGSVKVRYR